MPNTSTLATPVAANVELTQLTRARQADAVSLFADILREEGKLTYCQVKLSTGPDQGKKYHLFDRDDKLILTTGDIGVIITTILRRWW